MYRKIIGIVLTFIVSLHFSLIEIINFNIE